MKTFEVKGFWGFTGFIFMASMAVLVGASVPISVTWITWNALVSDIFSGPTIAFWQAALLTAAFAVAFKIVFQPEIAIHIKRVKSAEELENVLHTLHKPDPSKKS